MLSLDLSFSTALNPSLSNPRWPFYRKPLKPLQVTKTLAYRHEPRKLLSIRNTNHLSLPSPCPSPGKKPKSHRHILPPPAAGRSKKKNPTIQGGDELRREMKRNAQRKSRKLAESLFYRLKNPHKNHTDNFSDEELQMIGLGYDRMVRFMSKDDPNLKHPYDWYKYGEYGPYSWRGVVVGDPVRGRLSDECAHLYGSVRNQEEWDEIEQHDMAVEFGNRMKSFSKDVGLQNYWVFVRHPKWRLSDLPWEQWTLVSEVVLEAGNQRLDKWNLMGRLGNKTRELITKCAAWMRPDIIYVKRPVFQCRFEPQANFFRPLVPFLNPETEKDYLFELEDDQGRVELCTYFGGLCKIVKVSPKAFVDDVVKAYEKLSDEKKSKCLEFLLMNHPVQLLHPYTKEWKTRLEESELGCDAPDEDDNFGGVGEKEFTDWVEDDGDVNNDDDDHVDDEDGGEADDVVIDMDKDGNVVGTDDEDEEVESDDEDDEDSSPEEDENYWKEEVKKAMTSNASMEKVVKRSIEKTTELYAQQIKEMEENDGAKSPFRGKKAKAYEQQSRETDENDGNKSSFRSKSTKLYEQQDREMDETETIENENDDGDGDESFLRGKRAKVSPEEWKTVGMGRWKKKVKKSRLPPELFLRASVRLFTYRNLVKEIVLTRHAILDGEIDTK